MKIHCISQKPPHRHLSCFTGARAVIPIIVLVGFLGRACRPAPAALPPETFTLTVINGSGSGYYAAGSTAHIWANPYSQGWTFDTWRGDIGTIPDVRSMHATVTMPAADVKITATYRQILMWRALHDRISGRDMYYYFPPTDYKGVVFFFHGSGGDAREWLDLGAERPHFFDEMISAGYGIISIESHVSEKKMECFHRCRQHSCGSELFSAHSTTNSNFRPTIFEIDDPASCWSNPHVRTRLSTRPGD